MNVRTVNWRPGEGLGKGTRAWAWGSPLPDGTGTWRLVGSPGACGALMWPGAGGQNKPPSRVLCPSAGSLQARPWDN